MLFQARCTVSLAPLRVSPDHKSEQYSQLLLGDVVVCGEMVGQWVHVEMVWNGDAGWVLRGQLESCSVPLAPFHGLSAIAVGTLCGVFQGQHEAVAEPFDAQWQARYETASQQQQRSVLPTLVSTQGTMRHLAEHVNQCKDVLLGAPYAWGGMSAWGIDCSGLVQLIYRYRGIPLPHAASQQATYGRVLDFIQEVRVGDLAFFANDEGQIVHVGILLSPDCILHASAGSGRVQTDAMDWQGIINREGKRTHALRIITRLEEME